MAKLTAATRNALPSSSFVFPQARKPLSRAGAKGGSVQAKVRSAVSRRYPNIGKKVSLANLG